MAKTKQSPSMIEGKGSLVTLNKETRLIWTQMEETFNNPVGMNIAYRKRKKYASIKHHLIVCNSLGLYHIAKIIQPL